jgi:hypothetical protein
MADDRLEFAISCPGQSFWRSDRSPSLIEERFGHITDNTEVWQ